MESGLCSESYCAVVSVAVSAVVYILLKKWNQTKCFCINYFGYCNTICCTMFLSSLIPCMQLSLVGIKSTMATGSLGCEYIQWFHNTEYYGSMLYALCITLHITYSKAKALAMQNTFPILCSCVLRVCIFRTAEGSASSYQVVCAQLLRVFLSLALEVKSIVQGLQPFHNFIWNKKKNLSTSCFLRILYSPWQDATAAC